MKKGIIIVSILLSLTFILVACTEKNNFAQTDLKKETTISSKELYSIAEQGLKSKSDYSLQDYKSIDYTYNETQKQYIVSCTQGDDILGGNAIIYINAIDLTVESVKFEE